MSNGIRPGEGEPEAVSHEGYSEDVQKTPSVPVETPSVPVEELRRGARVWMRKRRVELKADMLRRLTSFASTAALVLGALTAVAAIIGLVNALSVFTPVSPYEATLRKDIAGLVKANKDLAERTGRMESRVESVVSRLEAIIQEAEGTETAVLVALVKDDLAAVQERIDNVEAVIVENPTKALSLVVLRQELDNLKSSHQEQYAAAQRDIERIYDQNKWFIGLIFTIALAMVGLAISNFMQLRKKKE